MKFTFTILLTSLFTLQAWAQQQATASINSSPKQLDNQQDEIDWSNFENELTDDTEDWTFHTDQALKLLYIDFEALSDQVSSLVIKCEQGKIIRLEDNLFDLPKNTIYEVNLQNLEKGRFFVELYTFEDKKVAEKELELK